MEAATEYWRSDLSGRDEFLATVTKYVDSRDKAAIAHTQAHVLRQLNEMSKQLHGAINSALINSQVTSGSGTQVAADALAALRQQELHDMDSAMSRYNSLEELVQSLSEMQHVIQFDMSVKLVSHQDLSQAVGQVTEVFSKVEEVEQRTSHR